MANICCDDVYLHSLSYQEHLATLFEVLKKSIVLCLN